MGTRVFTCHLTAYRASRQRHVSLPSLHDYLHYCRKFLAHIGRYIGRLSRYLSTDYRSIVDRYLTDTWPILHWQLMATYRPMHRPSVGRYIGRLSADMSTEATYSTHDPFRLLSVARLGSFVLLFRVLAHAYELWLENENWTRRLLEGLCNI